MTDINDIKYLCSDTMESYLDKVLIDEDTLLFCKRYIPWLITPIFLEVEGLVLLDFPKRDSSIVNWQKRIIAEGSPVYVEWDSNHIDGLNSYIPQISVDEQRNVAFFVYNMLKFNLKKSFPDYMFQIVLSYDDEFDIYNFHFYKYREEEPIVVIDVNAFITPMIAEII